MFLCFPGNAEALVNEVGHLAKLLSILIITSHWAVIK